VLAGQETVRISLAAGRVRLADSDMLLPSHISGIRTSRWLFSAGLVDMCISSGKLLRQLDGQPSPIADIAEHLASSKWHHISGMFTSGVK
jgi:hypothetical protein